MKQDDYLVPISSIAKEKKLTLNELSKYLYRGELALALGAGVSKSFGFPLWWELVNELSLKYYGKSSINENTLPKDLTYTIDEINSNIKNKLEFNELVKSVLYNNIDYINNDTIVQNELLISLSALMMGSRRGSIRNVITYNFDDLLEWYLGMHGIDVRVIQNPQRTTTNSKVIIYHPNGFLPLKSSELCGDKLIFSETSFISRQKEATPQDKYWEIIQERLFVQKIFIFVGLSGKDPTIYPRLKNIYENLLNKKRPIGFWFYKRTKEMDQREIKRNLNCGIVPIILEDNNLIPKYLLNICEYALARI
jgi:hypothetical protein